MHTRNLETSIRSLKDLRDIHHSQLDISVVNELNAVINDLEEVRDQQKSEQRQKACLRAVQMIAVVIRLVTNIRDLM